MAAIMSSSWSSFVAHLIPPIFFIGIALYVLYSMLLNNRRAAKSANLQEESVVLERREVELLESILEELRRNSR